jgi:predicted deacylase
VIEGEVGGRGAARRENVAYYKERVVAVARHLGILGDPEAAMPAGHTVWHLHPIETNASGVFLSEVELRTPVRTGDVLARVVDIHGQVVATVRAPADGVIGYHRVHAGVRPGDHLFTLWVPAGPPVSRSADLRAPNPPEAAQ